MPDALATAVAAVLAALIGAVEKAAAAKSRAPRRRCAHQRLHFQCVACAGPNICEHARVRSHCCPCGSSALCEHSHQRSRCRLCAGSCFCEHGRERRLCRTCLGSGVCAHGQLRVRCRTCAPVQYAMHLMRNRTTGMLRRAGLAKQHSTNSYLGCSGDEFSTHIARKMAAWNAEPAHAAPELQMTLTSIEIDHIKPCAAADAGEMRAITHFTNTQPLLKTHNRVKSDRWSAADDAYWLAHISHNAAFSGIYWPLACLAVGIRPEHICIYIYIYVYICICIRVHTGSSKVT